MLRLSLCFFQLPSPPLLLQDKTVAHPFQHFPQFHCQHRHVRVSSKVSVVSLPRTFESLESSSTNSFEVKSERFREIIYVYKMRKQILIMMMTVLLNILGSGDDDGDDLLGSGVVYRKQI